MHKKRMFYILNDQHEPVVVDGLLEWAKWMEMEEGTGDRRRVAFDEIGESSVSTVFLGLDHNHFGSGQPILFETMIFGGAHDGYQERCAAWPDALAQHNRACAMVTSNEQS